MEEKVIYPELSYKLIGLAYDVHNVLGGGLKESVYEAALSKALENVGLKVVRQLSLPVDFKGEKVGQRYIDMLVEGKIALELKTGDRFRKTNIDQIYEYLRAKDIKLGILVNFGSKEVRFRRILNIN